MSSSPLDDLAMVALDKLVLHETTESARAQRVCAEIERAGVLADPLVVTPARDGRYLVLDGAHRTAALRSLAMVSVVVQVMPLSATGARLGSWAHDLPAGQVPRDLAAPAPVGGRTLVATVGGPSVDGASLNRASLDGASLNGAGEGVPVTGPTEPLARAAAMSAVARRYAGRPYARAIPGTAVRPSVAARVSWAPWSAEDLLTLVVAGGILPAGTTRFVLPGRVLGVRVPLTALAAAPGEDGQPGLLDALRRQSVRTYTELVHVVEAGS